MKRSAIAFRLALYKTVSRARLPDGFTYLLQGLIKNLHRQISRG